ncbi:MAG: type II secretion system-associated lipoprotein [Leptospiraceae bacterium]
MLPEFRNKKAILALMPLLFAAYCSSPILKTGETVQWNQELEKTVYRAKTDIFPEFANQADKDNPLFPRGTLLKIQVESSPDWVKIRAREAKKERENTPGHVIMYLFSDDVDTEKGNGRQLVEERLNQLLSPAN